jgi:hypothetical protein
LRAAIPTKLSRSTNNNNNNNNNNKFNFFINLPSQQLSCPLQKKYKAQKHNKSDDDDVGDKPEILKIEF